MTGRSRAMSGFDEPVRRWQDIPGWFQWRSAQQEAVAHFGDGARFAEVGCYLGKSICSLAEAVRDAGRGIAIIGVDTARGSGPEGPQRSNAHGPAVQHGGGTFAGLLHRNVIACGFADSVQLVISDSVAAAQLFADESFAWIHIDARHDYPSVCADIAAWAPKVQGGGWLSGDDYDEWNWPGVVQAVADALPDAQRWWSTQWRWIKPHH
ncbi:class I SAM-dependent methyltransferase [Mycobacterium sp. B14F4]|uniref:class I SAM-dependent methyltransferase n=1 Tax=Mycobacterium sp. B14F4 TaxID=3153565 RepID=UPI00325E79F2